MHFLKMDYFTLQKLHTNFFFFLIYSTHLHISFNIDTGSFSYALSVSFSFIIFLTGLPISNGQLITVKKEGTYRAKGTPYKCGHFTIQPNTRLAVVLNTGTHVWVTQDKIKGRFEIPNEDIVLWSDVPSTLGSYLNMESCKLL